MKIGTTKELKNHEYRVGLTPDNVMAYVAHGHEVFVETGAGVGAGFADEEYINAGAKILATPKEVFDTCEMIVKVKEPEECEYDYLRKGQILYTYLHLAANKPLADTLIKRGVKAVAFETITDNAGNLPCLRPMSQIAGRLSIQEGAKYIEQSFGGRGILLGGVPGVERGKIVIIGGGVAGTYAAKAAVGIDAQVTLLDINPNRLAYIEDIFGASVTTLYSTEANIRKCLSEADLVIGSVLIPGGSTPKLVRREHLKLMKKGAVIVDIAIDQGGCCESSHVTTHDDPIFIEEGIVHYCVGNMPGAVPHTSTIALANTTIRYGLM
ncbi:MAG: alanine dehydrogenase, partial [Clostridiales bacterium]|nr:alanine dehydrogenase [Candidatus Coliplasma equi]